MAKPSPFQTAKLIVAIAAPAAVGVISSVAICALGAPGDVDKEFFSSAAQIVPVLALALAVDGIAVSFRETAPELFTKPSNADSLAWWYAVSWGWFALAEGLALWGVAAATESRALAAAVASTVLALALGLFIAVGSRNRGS